MNNNDFKITIKKLYWIDGSQVNKEDLCLHGDVEIRLNNQIIAYSPTVSAAALRLFRSIQNNHEGHKGNQLFPCCGHTMIANDTLTTVDILGCDDGLDWSVTHNDGMVTIEADDQETVTTLNRYKDEIFNFVNQVEDFYEQAGERILPDEDFERNGYIAFWNEWKDLKEKSFN